VGLPSDYFFTSRAGVAEDGGEGTEQGSVFVGSLSEDEDLDFDIPEEYRSWLILGYFPCAVAAIDPEGDAIYEFGFDGDGRPNLIHRDLASLVRSLIVLKKFCEEREKDEDLPAGELRTRIEALDALPFAAETSEWNRMLEELEDGIF
jgi:hypothetical protein